MKALPEPLQAYKQTPVFTEDTVPSGLLRSHRTKDAVWGRIIVLEGRLEYTINEPVEEIILLDQETPGVIEPTVLHAVKPLGPVRFYVEFYR